MKIVDLSQCKTDLDFRPLKAWPVALPILTYGTQVIAGFNRAAAGSALELDVHLPVHEYLASIYPALSATELLNLFFCLQHSGISFDSQALFSSFGFRFRESYVQLSQQMSAELQHRPLLRQWMAEKSLGFFEIETLLPFPDDPKSITWLTTFLKFAPGRSDGVKALEAYKELHLLGQALEIPADAKCFADIQNDLFQKRYPLRSEQIRNMQDKTKKISWPKSAQTKWNFDVDQPALEVRLKVQSANDIEKILASWSTISQQIKTEGHNPWA